MSNLFGGNRYKQADFYKKKKNFVKFIKKSVKLIDNSRILLVIENHQDLNSHDLNKIVNELGSEFVAINWDIGNSVACGETPDDFYNNSSKYIKNIHLKDYNIFYNGKIIILNRVPFGKGFFKKY